MSKKLYRSIGVAALGALVVVIANLPAQESPYAGMEQRPIKALSPERIEQYLTGQGMGLAMPAELNGYPGPRHVLELTDELGLSPEQRQRVQASYDAMHAEAVRLGGLLVENERRLDELFARQTVTGESLEALLGELGRLESRLRFAHLRAHLETRKILQAGQIEAYARLRGYAVTGHDHHRGHREP